MIYFHASLIATAVMASFIPTLVSANESCNVELSSGFTINSHSIEFLAEQADKNKEKRSLYKITDGKKLFVSNESIKLNQAQQKLIEQYDTKIRHLVPRVKSVAIEGINLAVEGVNLAFNGLLGEGNTVALGLTKELEVIREQVASNLSIEKGISVGVEGLESEELLGKDFDKRIETAVEKVVLNSMGSILIGMGQQMLSAKGDELSFEKRMENFGDTVEHEMTVRTEKIEKKAKALCVDIAEVDRLEERLKTEINQLASTNVFTVIQSLDESEAEVKTKL
jgi:hypothetical protein